MADQNTALPIRTEGDLQEKVQSKLVDFTNPSLGMQIDTDKNAHVEMHGDSPAGTDKVLRLSEIGALTPDGVYGAVNNTKPGNVGLIASARNASPDDTTQTQRLTAVTNGSKRLLDVSIHDEAGATYSATNPLPVTITATEGGTALHNYSTTANIVANASDNHTYTSAGVTTYVKSIKATASGKMKIEIQVDADGVGAGTFATFYVGFNSTANPNINYEFPEPIVLASGAVLRVIRTNKDNQAMDVYSTINGNTVV